jgi:hypothetical protein
MSSGYGREQPHKRGKVLTTPSGQRYSSSRWLETIEYDTNHLAATAWAAFRIFSENIHQVCPATTAGQPLQPALTVKVHHARVCQVGEHKEAKHPMQQEVPAFMLQPVYALRHTTGTMQQN